MEKQKTVTLMEPIPGHGGPVREVVLRAPVHADLWELGDPYVVMRLPDGSPHVQIEPKTLNDYLSRCLVSPDALLIKRLELPDSMRVRQAMIDFFEMAMVLSAASTAPSPSPTS